MRLLRLPTIGLFVLFSALVASAPAGDKVEQNDVQFTEADVMKLENEVARLTKKLWEAERRADKAEHQLRKLKVDVDLDDVAGVDDGLERRAERFTAHLSSPTDSNAFDFEAIADFDAVIPTGAEEFEEAMEAALPEEEDVNGNLRKLKKNKDSSTAVATTQKTSNTSSLDDRILLCKKLYPGTTSGSVNTCPLLLPSPQCRLKEFIRDQTFMGGNTFLEQCRNAGFNSFVFSFENNANPFKGLFRQQCLFELQGRPSAPLSTNGYLPPSMFMSKQEMGKMFVNIPCFRKEALRNVFFSMYGDF